jgi:hypothetical protein
MNKETITTFRTMKNIEIPDAMLYVAIIIFIILFAGDPDLLDAVLYNMTDGKIPLPVSE